MAPGVRPGAIVLEHSLAKALGIPVGTSLTLITPSGPIQLEVAGTAVSPSQARYPRSNPGVAWVTRGTLEQLVPDQSSWHWQEAVRLTDPSTAPTFTGSAYRLFPPGTVYLQSWQDQRAEALREADPIKVIATVYALLLIIVSVAVIAILIGARVSGQYREIALLKAVGLTPRQVSTVFAFEATTLGAVGILIGFVPGALLAPRLARLLPQHSLDHRRSRRIRGTFLSRPENPPRHRRERLRRRTGKAPVRRSSRQSTRHPASRIGVQGRARHHGVRAADPDDAWPARPVREEESRSLADVRDRRDRRGNGCDAVHASRARCQTGWRGERRAG